MRWTGEADGGGPHAPDGAGGGEGVAVTAPSRGLRRHVLDGAGEGVLPRPVREEVPVDVVHHVVEPPIEVDAAAGDAGDDPTGVVLVALLAGGIGCGHVLTQS